MRTIPSFEPARTAGRVGARRRLGAALGFAVAIATAGATGAAHARVATAPAPPPLQCLRAADRAAAAHDVPAAALRALTRTETGRARKGSSALEPWPWTVNMEGEGRWFDDPHEALRYIERHRARGARSFDVGCFQINHRWHGEAFPSVQAMFDPQANADYAARFLRELYEETGDWTEAAGLYHSRTPVYRDRYRARFERIMARGDDGGGAGGGEAADVRYGTRPPRAPALIADIAQSLPPAAAGAIAISVLRGGLSPLRGAAGPLIGPSRTN